MLTSTVIAPITARGLLSGSRVQWVNARDLSSSVLTSTVVAPITALLSDTYNIVISPAEKPVIAGLQGKVFGWTHQIADSLNLFQWMSVSPGVMDAPVSTLQLLMLQCQWHWGIHSCRVDFGASILLQEGVYDLHDNMITSTLRYHCSSVYDTEASILWMLQCQRHWSIHSYRVEQIKT